MPKCQVCFEDCLPRLQTCLPRMSDSDTGVFVSEGARVSFRSVFQECLTKESTLWLPSVLTECLPRVQASGKGRLMRVVQKRDCLRECFPALSWKRLLQSGCTEFCKRVFAKVCHGKRLNKVSWKNASTNESRSAWEWYSGVSQAYHQTLFLNGKNVRQEGLPRVSAQVYHQSILQEGLFWTGSSHWKSVFFSECCPTLFSECLAAVSYKSFDPKYLATRKIPQSANACLAKIYSKSILDDCLYRRVSNEFLPIVSHMSFLE